MPLVGGTKILIFKCFVLTGDALNLQSFFDLAFGRTTFQLVIFLHLNENSQIKVILGIAGI